MIEPDPPQISQDVLDRMNNDIGRNDLTRKSVKVDTEEMPESDVIIVAFDAMAKRTQDGKLYMVMKILTRKVDLIILENYLEMSVMALCSLKSRLGVGTSSNSEATDEQWKKCIKRYSDEKKCVTHRMSRFLISMKLIVVNQKQVRAFKMC